MRARRALINVIQATPSEESRTRMYCHFSPTDRVAVCGLEKYPATRSSRRWSSPVTCSTMTMAAAMRAIVTLMTTDRFIDNYAFSAAAAG